MNVGTILAKSTLIGTEFFLKKKQKNIPLSQEHTHSIRSHIASTPQDCGLSIE